MTTSDYIQAGELALAIIIFGAGALNRWAVANHRDRLAAITSAAGNAGGRIKDQLAGLPVGTDVGAIKAILVQNAAAAVMGEFGPMAAKVSATPDKIAGMITGQMGQATVTPASSPVVAVVDVMPPAREPIAPVVIAQ